MARKWKEVAYAICVLCAMIIFNAGCSSPNTQSSSSFNPETGHHVAGWADPAIHGASVKSQADGFSICQECHGSDYTGGISAVRCSTCHGGSAPHPTSWITGTYTHTNTNTANASVCAQCHTGGTNSPIAPPSPAAPSGTPPGCFNNTLCHAAAGHPSGWSDPAVHGTSAKAAPNPATTTGFSTCQTCHGTTFSGGAANTACASCHGGSAPHPTSWITGTYTHTTTDNGNASVCALCHTNGANSPIAPPSPPAPSGTAPGCFNSTLCHAQPACGSCHGIPPAGSVFPDIAGSHAPHMSANASIVCSTCHLGAGSGTQLHENGTVDVLLDPTYNANSGTATYNPGTLTCSNISCHGGSRSQTSTQGAANPPQSTPGQTPVWGSGTIDVNSQCTLCHVLGSSAGNPENNSYYSGQHQLHVYDLNKACTVCHDTAKLALVHFTSLTAPISESTASTTINSAINFNGTSCNPSAGGLTGCHTSHTW